MTSERCKLKTKGLLIYWPLGGRPQFVVIAPANVDKGAGRDVDRIFGFEGPARNWFGSLGDRLSLIHI